MITAEWLRRASLVVIPRQQLRANPNGSIAGGRGCYSAAFVVNLIYGSFLGLAQQWDLSLGPGCSWRLPQERVIC